MTDRTTGVRVLFAGQYWPGANTLYIARAFERCGAIVHLHNDTTLWPEWTGTKTGKIARRLLRRPIIESEWNKQLLQWVDRFQPDLVYVSSADFCWPSTLRAIRDRQVPIMCFYHDVKWLKRPGSRFSENIGYFDLVTTTRRWQEPEFKAAGARAVMVVRFGYEPSVHRPVLPDAQAIERYSADVVFIGTYETHRARDLESLVKYTFPSSFRLWGGYWNYLDIDSPLRPYWQKRHILESEIPVIYATSKIALHWVGWEPHGKDIELKKGDQHNSRTFQIAACGGALMLAQRTEEHLQLFMEDVEAVYFDDIDELHDKLAYWLDPAHAEARKCISAAAYSRCVRENYSYVPVVKRYLQHFGLPTAESPI